MTTLETQLSLETDEVAVASYLDEHDGRLLRDPDDPTVYWLSQRPSSDPSQTYYARVSWSEYPAQPPSVRFHRALHGDFAVSSAWPQIAGYRINSWDICKPFTAEGFALHPEWQGGPSGWTSTGNPFLFVAHMLQHDLNNNYQGRNP